MTYSVYLSLGSNINPREYVSRTVLRLNETYGLRAISSVYRTKPVAMVEGSAEFHNLCVEIETDLKPGDLKNKLRDLEEELGRERPSDPELYQPRVMDVDILIYEPEHEDFVPHSQIYDQAFVIYPLSEIYDPSNREDLPDDVEEWKQQCNESVILGTVDYNWPGELTDLLLD